MSKKLILVMRIILRTNRLRFATLSLIIISALVPTGVYAATTRYVAVTGTGNACTQSSPCSFSSANSVAEPGDVIQLADGVYTESHGSGLPWNITKNNITIMAKNQGAAIISGGFMHPAGFKAPPKPGEHGPVKKPWYADADKGGYWYQSLIRVTGDNVTIDGIVVEKSTGIGIEGELADNLVVQDCTLRYNFSTGIRMGKHGRGSNNSLLYSTVHNNNYIRDAGVWRHWQSINNNVSVHGLGSVVRGNTIFGSPCAGIEDYTGTGAIFEDNIVYGNNATQIHTAKSNGNIIRNNLIYGSPRTVYTDEYGSASVGTGGYGTGISLRCETWDDESGWNDGIQVYGNMIANTHPLLHFGVEGSKDQKYWQKHQITNAHIYNNTFVEPSTDTKSWYAYPVAVRLLDAGHIGTGNVIENNIFWVSSDELDLIELTFGGDAANISWRNNLWNKLPNVTGVQADSDPRYNLYPALSLSDYLSKDTGWNNLTPGSLTVDDFNLRSTATHAINTGSNQGLGDDIGAKQYTGTPSTAKAELVADAFLENGVARNLDNLKIQNSSSRIRESYLKFSVSGVDSGTIESVQFKVTCAGDPGNGNVRVYLGSHNNWNEQNLAASAPAKEVLVDSMNSVYTSGAEYVFDISSVVSADGEYTLVMSMDREEMMSHFIRLKVLCLRL